MRNTAFLASLVLIAILVVFPVMQISAKAAEDTQEVPAETQVIAMVEESEDSGPAEIEYLESINVYMAYIFFVLVLFLCFVVGYIVYRFFNMFF